MSLARFMKLLYIFLFLSIPLWGQSFNYRDSVSHWYQNEVEINKKVAFYNNSGDSIICSRLYLELGIYNYNQLKNYDQALRFYEASLSYNPLKTKPDYNIQGKNYLNINLIYKKKGALNLSHNYLKKALSYFIMGEDNCGKSYVYNKLGITYYNSFKFEKSIEIYQLGLSFCDADTCPVLTDLYSNIGSSYLELNNYMEGFNYINEAIHLAKIKRDTMRIKSNYIKMIHAAGTYNTNVNPFDYYDTLQMYNNISPDPYAINTSKLYLASFYFKNNNINKALELLNFVEDYFLKIQDYENLKECYLLKSNIFFSQKRFADAYYFQDKFLELDYNRQLNENVDSAFLDLNFNYDKRVLKLNQVEQEVIKDQEQLKKQKWIYILFLIFTILLIYQVFRLQKKIDQFKDRNEAPFVFNQKDFEEEE